jgi:hypothetical protein
VKTKILHFWLFLLIAVLLLSYSQLAAGEEFKTIIGPRNVDLADGADALLMGRGEEGVRLTLRGLEIATGDRERKIAHSNLCAGYIMIDKPLTALEHCNWVVDRYPDFWRRRRIFDGVRSSTRIRRSSRSQRACCWTKRIR